MNNILQLIESKNTNKIKEWIDSQSSIEQSDFTTNDLLFIAEKLSSISFYESPSNLIFAQLTTDLYTKLYQLNPSSESALFSSLYVRLRILKENSRENLNQFFSSQKVVEEIRRKFNVPLSEIRNRALIWQTLEIDEIKKLRSYKLWLNLLTELEEIEKKEYPEFDEWKSLRSVLP